MNVHSPFHIINHFDFCESQTIKSFTKFLDKYTDIHNIELLSLNPQTKIFLYFCCFVLKMLLLFL